MKKWTTVDKTSWGAGPWVREPDKIHWIDPATDLDCLVVRNRLGAWCGYVGVPEGHPLFQKGYSDLDLEVHGGLTFAGPCEPDASESEGICHTPAPGRPHDVWWLGFDCAHGGDRMPGLEARERAYGFENRGMNAAPFATYRTVRYVRREVQRLAKQVALR